MMNLALGYCLRGLSTFSTLSRWADTGASSLRPFAAWSCRDPITRNAALAA